MSDTIQETLDQSNEAAQKLERLLEGSVSVARSTIEAGDENLPSWLLEDVDGCLEIIVTPWSCDEDKRAIDFVIRARIKLAKIVRMVFISETWVVQSASRQIHCQPSEHPDRKEMLMVNGEDKSGAKIFTRYEILRPQNKLGPKEQHDYAEATGLFVNMF